MQEIKDEIHKLSLTVDTLVKQRIGFNGDKRELFDRLISVESKVDNINVLFQNFITNLPCKEHSSTLRQAEINIEKGKFQTLLVGFSFLFSTIAAIGVVFEILKK